MENNFNKVTSEIVDKLKDVVSGGVYTGESINVDFWKDEMPIYGQSSPDVLVEVHSTEEVSNVMKICNENKIPVVARGAGSGLVGSSVAFSGGVMIDMQEFNKILEYDEDNFVVTVEPGVILNDLAEDALSKGLLYPPDPGERYATIGGNVSTNAGGMRAVKYGTTRDYVRKVEVVLPTGEITTFGGNVSKTSSGYSLKDLIVGSEGTLAIITKIMLQLVPAPTEDISMIVIYENLHDCISTVPKLLRANVSPQSLEFMEREIVEASERYIGKKTFPTSIDGVEAGAYLIVRFDGNDLDALYDLVEKAGEVVLDNGALDVLLADTPDKKKNAWAARGAFLEAIEAETKLLDECDVVVPVSKIADYLQFVNETAKNYDFEVKSFGHAGDGNLHIYQCSNDMDEEEFKKQVDDFLKIIYKKAYDIEGLLSGEHGVGKGKVHFLRELEGKTNIGLMKGIKKAFDPNGILNPGKII